MYSLSNELRHNLSRNWLNSTGFIERGSFSKISSFRFGACTPMTTILPSSKWKLDSFEKDPLSNPAEFNELLDKLCAFARTYKKSQREIKEDLLYHTHEDALRYVKEISDVHKRRSTKTRGARKYEDERYRRNSFISALFPSVSWSTCFYRFVQTLLE